MQQTGDDPKWTEDVSILFSDKKWMEFMPNENQKKNQAFNATSRLVIYASVLYTLVSGNLGSLVLGAAVLSLLSYSDR